MYSTWHTDVRAPADRTSLLATKVLLEGEVVGADTGVGVPGMRAGPWGTGLNYRRRQGGRCDHRGEAYDLTVHGRQNIVHLIFEAQHCETILGEGAPRKSGFLWQI